MAWYTHLDMQQEPFDMGLDQAKRVRYGFNILMTKRPSATMLMEVIGLLVAGGVGTFGTTIFKSSKAVIPTGPGPFLSVIATGGLTPLRTHNEVLTSAYTRPGAQIVARGEVEPAVEALAYAAYTVLVKVRNQAVVPP